MIKIITTAVLSLIFVSVGFAQSEKDIRNILKDVNTLDQVDSLKEAFPNWDIKISRTSAKGIFSDNTINKTKIGEMCKVSDLNNTGGFVHKIMDKKKEEHCKVQYIFFHGKNRTIQALDSIRAIVLDKFAKGIDFKTLHNQYNEDGSPTGVLNWFYRGIMVKEFDAAVFSRKKKEIFKVDIPRLHWHYIILKSEKNKIMNVTYSLSVKIKD